MRVLITTVLLVPLAACASPTAFGPSAPGSAAAYRTPAPAEPRTWAPSRRAARSSDKASDHSPA